MVSRIAKLSMSLPPTSSISSLFWFHISWMEHVSLWIFRFRMLQSGTITIKQMKCWIWIQFSHLHGFGYFQALLVLSQLGQPNLSQLKMELKLQHSQDHTTLRIWRKTFWKLIQEEHLHWHHFNSLLGIHQGISSFLISFPTSTWITSVVSPCKANHRPWRLWPFHQPFSFGSGAAVAHHTVIVLLLKTRGKTTEKWFSVQHSTKRYDSYDHC